MLEVNDLASYSMFPLRFYIHTVQEDESNYSKAGNTSVQVLLANVDGACDYFASVSFDPKYDINNFVKFLKLPQHDDGYCDSDLYFFC